MADRTTDPPGSTADRPRKGTDPGRTGRIKPEQCEIKVRWESGRRVRKVSPTGVHFDFDNALKVGSRYPISLNAPGVSFSSTLEVTRCQVILEPGGKRYFSIEGRFFPYVE